MNNINYNQMIVPMLPGYALGDLISKWNLALPYFQKKHDEIHNSLKVLDDQKAHDLQDQATINLYNAKIMRAEAELKKIDAARNECLANSSIISVEHSLPLDTRHAKVVIENRAFRSERLEQLQFKSTKDVYDQIQNFVKKLFLYDVAPSSILPDGALENLTSKVEELFKEGQVASSVTLIGGFITSERVKSISPLVLGSVEYLNEDLKRNAANYFVLTEAVLGGVFLGLGRTFVQIDPNSASAEDKWRNSLVNISFISRGAITKLNPRVEEVNLWTVYTDWQNSMLTDEHSGYPLGFKVRHLPDVLAENGVEPSLQLV